MNYDVVIGLEVHVQVATATKLFCGCPNRYGEEPNTLVCPVCMGYPGVLPVPNEAAIRRTILAGLVCNCEITRLSKFDRKSYFYPDMPKNFQISQYELPLCLKGSVDIGGKGFSGDELPSKAISMTRIHLEEDVGKLTHLQFFSGVDYNRAGVPLMEIVSEPDMASADEAYAYLTALKQAMEYARISNCDMEKGQMRCDVNISLKPAGSDEFGAKIEIKNLNSLKAVHRSLEYEIERQAGILDSGGTLEQSTRGWNDDAGETYLLRRKESAHDYRYFPEPDLMPIQVSDEMLAEIRSAVPETPAARRQRCEEEYGIPAYDANVLTLEKDCADYFERCVAAGGPAKTISNWIMVELLRELSQSDTAIADCPVSPENLAALIGLIDKNVINGKIAKTVFVEMFKTGADPAAIVKEKGLEQVTDSSEITRFVQEAVAANPGPVQEFRSGKEQALNFLVGQVMKLSRGKANPQMAAQGLKDEIERFG